MQSFCTICYDLFNASVVVVATECGHIFHNDCINHWFARSYTCPECRKEAHERSLTKLAFHDISDYDVEKSSDALKKELNAMDFEIRAKDIKIQELTDMKTSSERDIVKMQEKLDGTKKHMLDLSAELKDLNGIKITTRELLDQNKHLRKENLHLKNAKTVVEGCFNDTEKILKNMQLQVSSEEKNYSRRLAAFCCKRKKELIRLKEEKIMLQNKLMQMKRKKEIVHADCKKKRQRKQHFNVSKMNTIVGSESSSQSPFPIILGAPNDHSRDLIVFTLACCSSGENQVNPIISDSRNDVDLKHPGLVLPSISTGNGGSVPRVRYRLQNHGRVVKRKK